MEKDATSQPTRHSGVPPELARMPMRTFTARNAAAFYSYPHQRLSKLTARGLLHRPAHGYYTVVPLDHLDRRWLPGLEATAAGIATAVFDADHAVLMGISAARVHGAIPRALAVAVVAVPRQRAALRLTDRDAIVRFVTRDTDNLDAETISTELGSTLVTTPEQTVLDLAHRPDLGDSATDVPTAVRTLYRRCDPEQLDRLAHAQRLRAALDRVMGMLEYP
ncbi:type IV toxin-antitoxin system AbiEi family antitoxin domain-containing protein [Nocardia aurantia]|uniref:AbiEi antitoxin C-terminal domain-containing protein n=1 Tax=Nocardia aurantia TaxID=2585199 RepID=A0A7K0DKH4_9NOCA|nr:type IV toxin-antitoxin system AbiEi family antitoxin [Nocardia aurantia]MQY25722.1 hypothetical protein [Nocardia aurantia]